MLLHATPLVAHPCWCYFVLPTLALCLPQTFVKAVLANWFVCLAIWQANAAQVRSRSRDVAPHSPAACAFAAVFAGSCAWPNGQCDVSALPLELQLPAWLLPSSRCLAVLSPAAAFLLMTHADPQRQVYRRSGAPFGLHRNWARALVRAWAGVMLKQRLSDCAPRPSYAACAGATADASLQ